MVQRVLVAEYRSGLLAAYAHFAGAPIIGGLIDSVIGIVTGTVYGIIGAVGAVLPLIGG